VPTVREEGYDVTFTMWRAALAPKGTPPPIVEKLESVFKKISEDRSFVALIKQLGDEVDFQGSREFGATWRQEWDAIGKVAAGAQR
jgi:tripartite-type tricarboxylate transporter receptor subunit TctC